MFKFLKSVLKEVFCDHKMKDGHSAFKIIVVPIDFNPKNSDALKMGIKPKMIKICRKCKRMECAINEVS